MGLITTVYAVIFSLAVVIYIGTTIQYRRLMGEMEKQAQRAGLRLDDTWAGLKRAQEIHQTLNTHLTKQLLNRIEALIPAYMLRFKVVVGLGVVGLVLVLFEL